MLSRYLVFAYMQYDAGGGWSDFKGSYETPDEALDAAKVLQASQRDGGQSFDWAEVIDGQTGKEVTP